MCEGRRRAPVRDRERNEKKCVNDVLMRRQIESYRSTARGRVEGRRRLESGCGRIEAEGPFPERGMRA